MAANFDTRCADLAMSLAIIASDTDHPAAAGLYRTAATHLPYLDTPARVLAYAEDLEQRSTDLDADDDAAQRMTSLAGRLRATLTPTTSKEERARMTTLVDVHLNDGTAVRAEQVAPGLAIQPALAGDNEYTGRWHLVHIPSNNVLNGRSVGDLPALRAAAATIVAAGHDWSVPERDVPDEAIRVAHDAIRDLYAAVGLL